jgi:nucleolar pre-ribosomal-associated protein 1
LLSFLDDCVRRCSKTPYRYLEDAQALLADTAGRADPSEDVSPLLMTTTEQISAKVLGQHIATEAALVVIHYLRRVLVALMGKQKGGQFVNAIVEKLENVVREAKSKGQARLGLGDAVALIRHDVGIIVGDEVENVPETAVSQLLDDACVTSCLRYGI